MAYIANTSEERGEMLAAIGAGSVRDLFSDVPAEIVLDETPAPPALSEYETLRLLRRRSEINRPAASAYLNFMGAGAYEHFIPAAVSAIAQRGEILTAYTPYQGEASQGTLQIVYEFQSMISALTGLEVANASMYDGASALAEAALMALRIDGKRNQVLVPESLHPAYREALISYTKALGVEVLTWSTESADSLNWPDAGDDVAAVIVQHPNFFGYLEPVHEIAAEAKKRGALVISVANPMSLSVLEPPAEWGAEIAVGEIQPLGLPLNFGGPYAGYMATLKEHIRKMPGRLVGKTLDVEGREAFVLTLQTREQHIRRERATSNICTNQGLCATMATVHMALIGKSGFEQLGRVNLARAGALAEMLTAIDGVELASDAPFFNEFTLRLPMDAREFSTRMRAEGILPGLPAARLGDYDANLLIVCATETRAESDLEAYAAAARKVIEG